MFAHLAQLIESEWFLKSGNCEGELKCPVVSASTKLRSWPISFIFFYGCFRFCFIVFVVFVSINFSIIIVQVTVFKLLHVPSCISNFLIYLYVDCIWLRKSSVLCISQFHLCPAGKDYLNTLWLIVTLISIQVFVFLTL